MSSQTFETYVVDGYADEGFVTNVSTLSVDLQSGQSTTAATVSITKPVQELASGDATVTGLAENSITSLNTDIAASSATVSGVTKTTRLPVTATVIASPVEVDGLAERIIEAGNQKINLQFVPNESFSGTQGPGKIPDVITSAGNYIAIQGGQNNIFQVYTSSNGASWSGARPTGITAAQYGSARRLAKVTTDTYVVVGGGSRTSGSGEDYAGGRIWYTEDNFSTIEYVDLDTILEDVGLGNGLVAAQPIRLMDVAVGGGKIVVTGNWGIILTASTSDLDTWTLQDAPSWTTDYPTTAGNDAFVAWSGTRFVLTIGRCGTAFSTDGSSWTVQNEPKGVGAPHPHSSGVVRGIEYGGGEFVLFTSEGHIYKTTNGSTVTQVADPEEIGPVNLTSAKYNPDTDVWAIVGSGGTIVTGQYDAENWVYQTSTDNEVDGRPLRDLTGVAYKNERWVIVGGFKLIAYTDPVALVNGVELNAFSSQVEVSVAVDRDPVDAVIQATGVEVDATVSRVVSGGDINHEAESSIVAGVAERIIYQVGSANFKPTDNNLISAGGVERIITSGEVALRPSVEHEVSGVGDRQININGDNNVEIVAGSSTITAVAERELRDNDVDLIAGSSSVSANSVERTVNGIDATPHAQNSTIDVTARLSFLIRIAIQASDAEVVASASRSYAGVDIALTSGSSHTTGSGNIGRYVVDGTPAAQPSEVVGLAERGVNGNSLTVVSGDSRIEGFTERVITATGSIVSTPVHVESEGIAEREVNIIDGTVAASSSQVSGLAENAITGVGTLVSGDASIAVGRAERSSVLLSGVGPQQTSSVTGVAERHIDTNGKTQRLTQGDASISGSGNLGYPASGDIIVTDVAKVVGLGQRGSNVLEGIAQGDDADVTGLGSRGTNELDASLTQGVSEVTGLGERTVNSTGAVASDISSVTGLSERAANGTGALTTTTSLVAGVAENTVVNEEEVSLFSGDAVVDGLSERTVVRLPDVWAYYVGPKNYVDPAASTKTFAYKTPSPAPIAATKFIISGQTGAKSKYNGTYEVWTDGGVVIDTPMQVTGTGLNGINATQSEVKVHAVNAPYGTSGAVGIVNLYLRETATKYQWLVLTLDRDQTEATDDDKFVWHAIETSKSIDFRVTTDTIFSGVWTSDRLAISTRESTVVDSITIAPRSFSEFNTLQPAASTVVGATEITSNGLEGTLETGASSVTAVVERSSNSLSAELVSQQAQTFGFAFGIEIIQTELVQSPSRVTGKAERAVNDIDATPVVSDHSDVVAVVEITSNALPPRNLVSTDVFVQGVAERTVEDNNITNEIIASDVTIAGVAEREIDDNLATHEFKPTDNNLIVGVAEREIRSAVTLETGTSSASGVAERTINSASSPRAGSSSVTGLAERTVEDNLIVNDLVQGESSVGGRAEREIVDVTASVESGSSSVADGGTKIERKPIVAALQNQDSRTATDPKGVVTRHIDAAVQSGDSKAPGKITLGSNLREGIKRVQDATVSGVAEREIVVQSGIGIPSIVPAENSFISNVTDDSLEVIGGSTILRGTYTRVNVGGGNWVIKNSRFTRSEESEGYVAWSKVNYYSSNRRDFIIYNKDTSKWVNVYYQFTSTIPVGSTVSTQYNIGFPLSVETNRTTTPSLVDGVSTRTVNGITGNVQAQSASTPNSIAERQIDESPDDQDFNLPASPSQVGGIADREITVDAGIAQVTESTVTAAVEYKKTTRVELRSGPSDTPNSFAFGIEDLYESVESGPSHVVGAGHRTSNSLGAVLESQESTIDVGRAEREIVNVPDYTFFYSGTVAGLGPKTTGTNFTASYSGVDFVITSPTAYAGTYAPITNDDGLTIVMTSPGVFETRSDPSYNRYVKYNSGTGTYSTLVLWDRTSESAGARWLLVELNSNPNAWVANQVVSIPSFVTYSTVANPGTPLQISTSASRPVAYTLNTSKVEQGDVTVTGSAERVIENNAVRQDLVQGDASVTGLGERTININEGIDLPDTDSLVGGVAERIIDDNLAVHDLRPTEYNVVAGQAERIIEQNEATALLKPTDFNLVAGTAERVIETNGEDQDLKPTDFNLVVGVAERKMVSEPIAIQPSENNIVIGIAERIIDDNGQEDIALNASPSTLVGVAERIIEANALNQNVDAEPSEVTGISERTVNGLVLFVDSPPVNITGFAERIVKTLTRQDLTAQDVTVAGAAERVIDTNDNTQDLIDEESDVIGIAERGINTLDGNVQNSSDSIVLGVAEREIRSAIQIVASDSIVTGDAMRNIDVLDDSITSQQSTVTGVAEREVVLESGIGGALLTPAADPNIVYVEDDITLNYPSYSGNGYYTLVTDRRMRINSSGFYVESVDQRAYTLDNGNGTYNHIIWHEFFDQWVNLLGSSEDITSVAIDGTVSRTASFAGTLTQYSDSISRTTTDSIVRAIAERKVEDEGINHELLTTPSVVAGVAERIIYGIPNANINTQQSISGLGPKVRFGATYSGNNFVYAGDTYVPQAFTQGVYLEYQSGTGWAPRQTSSPNSNIYVNTNLTTGGKYESFVLVDISGFSSNTWAWLQVETVSDPSTWTNAGVSSPAINSFTFWEQGNNFATISTGATRVAGANFDTILLSVTDSLVVGGGARELDDVEEGGTNLGVTESLVVGNGVRTSNLLQSPASGPSVVVGLGERTVEDNELNHALESGVSTIAGISERQINRIADGEGPDALSPSSNDANVSYNSAGKLVISGFAGHLAFFNGTFEQFRGVGYVEESGSDYIIYPEFGYEDHTDHGSAYGHNAYLRQAGEDEYFIVVWNETQEDWYISFSTGDPFDLYAGDSLPSAVTLQYLLATNSELQPSPFKSAKGNDVVVAGISERGINLTQSPSSQESTVSGVAERTVEDNELNHALESGASTTTNTAKITRRPIVAAVKAGPVRVIGVAEDIVVGQGPQFVESGNSTVVGAGFRTSVEEETPVKAQDAVVAGVAERTVVDVSTDLVSQDASASGVAERQINGAGSLVATQVVGGSVDGEGDREIDQNGETAELRSQDSRVDGVAERKITATGDLQSQDSTIRAQIYQTLGFQEAIPVEQRFRIAKKPVRVILIRRPASGDS